MTDTIDKETLLNDRKQALLRATISHYIETAEPVGSKVLNQEYEFGVSSATIRNDLNELEKDGYLTQLHASSGRVPTDQGYRLYVDTLMQHKPVTAQDQAVLQQQLSAIGQNLNNAFSQVSQIVSSVIDYTTIVLTPDLFQESLKLVHLILVDLDRVLVVLLHSAGVNQEVLLDLGKDISQDDLNKLSQLLTQKLEGKSLDQFDQKTLSAMIHSLPEYQHVLSLLQTELLKFSENKSRRQQLLMNGTSKMLSLPEFQNVELTQKVLSTLEESKVLMRILAQHLDRSPHCDVVIGAEHEEETLRDCSLVISPVTIQDQPKAAIGILGPKRMPYSRVLPMVKNISQMITSHMSRGK